MGEVNVDPIALLRSRVDGRAQRPRIRGHRPPHALKAASFVVTLVWRGIGAERVANGREQGLCADGWRPAPKRQPCRRYGGEWHPR